MLQQLTLKLLAFTSAIAYFYFPIFSVQAAPLPQKNVTPASTSNQIKLKLYGGVKTRTPMVQWYLEELGIPYEYISLNISAGENRKPEYLAINSLGKVPAIVDGNLKLWESGAILLYLAEKYDKKSTSLEESAQVMQWVFFANTTLSPALFTEDKRKREMPNLLVALNQILQDKSFLVGNKLSAADIAVVSYLYYAKILVPVDYTQYPAINSYLDKMTVREAFKNTVGKR
ncbi:glutathione S-transferase family protein [Calothrix sp. PCC 6303]|uniref:glutathione S-transferase family protein n=1 Tax=Calothrix sp. PCC 6303 TaxID=1170562 RepID=UPI0002A02C26|nr:glutathione S-transferase family protein [Calothrix sp. PCC 6303]AFZ02655.1 Glutathione S-transferase domain protein [Calothrix sp. PCC 6303]